MKIVKKCLKCSKVLDIYEDCCDCGSISFSDKYQVEEVKIEPKKKGKKEAEKEDFEEIVEENKEE
jgi:hypothetical protein